jgi:heptosyltransferase-1
MSSPPCRSCGGSRGPSRTCRLGKFWRSPKAAGKLWRFLRQLRKGRYDWVIDLQGLLRSAIFTRASHAPLRAGFGDGREGAPLFYNVTHTPLAPHTVRRNIELAQGLGIDARDEDMTLQVTHAGEIYAHTLRTEQGLTDKNYVVCVPPTRWATKRYPARRWRAVIDQLRADCRVVVTGTPDDIAYCDEITSGMNDVLNVTGQTSVEQLVGLIAHSGGVVCCDSAAKFIAPAVGANVVCLIGPTQLDRTGPYPHGRAIVSPALCQGCLRKRCKPAGICMALIDPDQVVAETRAMLAEARP